MAAQDHHVTLVADPHGGVREVVDGRGLPRVAPPPDPALAATIPAVSQPADPASLALEEHTPPSLARLTPAQISLLFTHAGEGILSVRYPLFADLDDQQFAAVPDYFFRVVGTMLFQDQPTSEVPARIVYRFGEFHPGGCTVEMYAVLPPPMLQDLFMKPKLEEKIEDRWAKIRWEMLVRLTPEQYKILPHGYFLHTHRTFNPTAGDVSIPSWLFGRYNMSAQRNTQTLAELQERVDARLQSRRAWERVLGWVMLVVVVLGVSAAVIISLRMAD